MQAFDAFKDTKDIKVYKTIEAEVLNGNSEIKANILKLMKQIHDVDKAFSERISLLQVLLEERYVLTKSYQSKMIDFITKASSNISEATKKEMKNIVEKFDNESLLLEGKIKNAESNA